MILDKSIQKLHDFAKEEAVDILGQKLLAIYIIGSIAHGGFSFGISDVDIAYVIEGEISEVEWSSFEELEKRIKSSGLPLSSDIAIFWSSFQVLSNRITSGAFPPPNRKDGIFPPFDVIDLLQYGIITHGKDIRSSILKPSLQALKLSGIDFLLSYVNTSERNRTLLQADLFFGQSEQQISKTILFPVRLIYTFLTGDIASNDLAASHFINLSRDKPLHVLIEQAILIRKKESINMEIIRKNFSSIKNLYIALIDKSLEIINEQDYLRKEALQAWRSHIEDVL